MNASVTLLPPTLTIGDMALRWVTPTDFPFLRELYRDVRAPELALTGWPQPMKNAFCDSQFDMQDRHYRMYYPDAVFYLIERAGVPVGRLYLSNTPQRLDLVEVSLTSKQRGNGRGAALLQWMTECADATQRPMVLHVEPANPARRLYERFGFAVQQSLEDAQEMRLTMFRPAQARPQQGT